MILTISGPAGTGKTMLTKNLLAARDTFKIATNVTTRAPRRDGDLPGDYLFVDEAGFDKLLAQGEIILPFLVHGKRYGTSKKIFFEALHSSDWYLWARMPQALVPLYEVAGENKDKIRSVFLSAPAETELRRRLTARGDHDTLAIETRISDCRDWESYSRGLPLNIFFIPAGTPDETVRAVLKVL